MLARDCEIGKEYFFNGRKCRVLNKSIYGVVCLTPEMRQAIFMPTMEVSEPQPASAPPSAPPQNSACKVTPADAKIGNKSEKKTKRKAARHA